MQNSFSLLCTPTHIKPRPEKLLCLSLGFKGGKKGCFQYIFKRQELKNKNKNQCKAQSWVWGEREREKTGLELIMTFCTSTGFARLTREGEKLDKKKKQTFIIIIIIIVANVVIDQLPYTDFFSLHSSFISIIIKKNAPTRTSLSTISNWHYPFAFF